MANTNQKRSDYARFKALNPVFNKQRLAETSRIFRCPIGPMQGQFPSLAQADDLLFLELSGGYMEKRTREQHIRGLLADLHILLCDRPTSDQRLSEELEGYCGDNATFYSLFKIHYQERRKNLLKAIKRIQRGKLSHLPQEGIPLAKWDRFLFSTMCPDAGSEMDAQQRGKILRGILTECGIKWAIQIMPGTNSNSVPERGRA